MCFDGIFGNEKLKKTILSFTAEKKLPHAIIIEGQSGSGKTHIARAIAASLTDNKTDIDKILSSQSPDVIEITLSDGKKTIGVDTVREIRSKAVLIPNDLEYKFFIIEASECMTTQAQNALLKIIEEPPAETYFLLLTKSLQSLLPTVRSRSVIFKTEVFSDSMLDKYLQENSSSAKNLKMHSPDKYDHVIKAAKGTIGNALVLIQSHTVLSKDDIILNIIKAMAARNKFELLSSVNKLPSDREQLKQALINLRSAIRDVIAISYDSDSRLYIFADESIPSISEDKLFAKDKMLSDIEKDLLINPNVSAVKYHIFSILQ